MPDMVRVIGGSIVQAGHLNRRIYVMKLATRDIPGIIHPLDALARAEGYTKIFAKVPEPAAHFFSKAGYVAEARVPFFFRGRDDAVFMAKYFDAERDQVFNSSENAEVLSTAFGYAQSDYVPRLPEGFSLVRARTGDAREMAALYRSVFVTYPFPVFDADFLVGSMRNGTRYFTIRSAKSIVAIASCDIDAEFLNAEMTDFVTDPRFRRRGLAGCLLHAMETDIARENIRIAFTIARASSCPINITFSRAGFRFAGVLPNNTNIGGGIESMNVWYKRLGSG